MGGFQFSEAAVPGLVIIEACPYRDHRGSFTETYCYGCFADAGIGTGFVQDNISVSRKGVLRGLHYQRRHPQAKLIQVILGEIFDVAVDLREDSPFFKCWFGIRLSEENHRQLYIPEGFAHGFLALSDMAVVAYKCSDYYDPCDEGRVAWNDESIGIEWPLEGIGNPVLSGKDGDASGCRRNGWENV